jgi:hypothetical protein
MEIHPPQGHIGSVKDFLIHLSMIVIGILIALSLEGAVEWVHHRGIAREAEASLAAEIKDNHQRLIMAISRRKESERQLDDIVSYVHAIQDDRKTAKRDLAVEWINVVVHETSWNSAVNTGALSYMDISKVQRYTRLYDLQREFVGLQGKAFDSIIEVQGLGTRIEKDPAKLTNSELEQAERVLGMALARSRLMKQIDEILRQAYEQ